MMFVRRWFPRGLLMAGRARGVAAALAVRRGDAADRGMTTAEYAVGTLAACAAAAVLYKVLSGGAVEAALRSVIGKALGVDV
ncbi:DUF4244 domain-containing protein [Streptomyces rimosus subsp. rimosus ATCC 10970]|uniref:DUF4244 domain-containing protein n=3 Tax=Streptomyces TaxID=1883 RepID=A0A8A1UVN9_STRR1|nr:DUF4244 domain-containing protein [Streptomyces sp. SID5471]QDA05321.1 DUF4244 domain-containing protein [Streptomyces rimosus]QGY65733.1 DUF4244 domain-containing protein [Streptomyces rimosus R6-500]QST82644.1 DUF4244 domain-containing protein [Streptomyces rimosus subsp. rimosus ATCC 10970]QTL87425.1 DUF4244 domain-containing protein [Streptomyces rimosus subsp. rimosus]RSO08123.1 DUF4244 domain-containing protein [Streptomyces sp. WAC 06783]